MSLAACPACSRHVRRTEPRCPFCSAALALGPAPQRALPGRLGRTATFAFGAALSTTAACSSPSTPAEDAGTDAMLEDVYFNDVAVYGGPDTGAPVDAGSDTGTDAGVEEEDTGGAVPLYGGPPIDAGPEDDAGNEPDTGGGVTPLYGGPPAD